MSHREIYAIKRRTSPSGRGDAKRNPRQVGRYMTEEEAPSLSEGRLTRGGTFPLQASLAQDPLAPGRFPLSVSERVQRNMAILAEMRNSARKGTLASLPLTMSSQLPARIAARGLEGGESEAPPGTKAPSQDARGRRGAAGDPAAPDGHLISKRPGRRRA